jgi:hypothetical protein
MEPREQASMPTMSDGHRNDQRVTRLHLFFPHAHQGPTDGESEPSFGYHEQDVIAAKHQHR